MKHIRIFTLSVFCFLSLVMVSFVLAGESNDFIMTEDSFSPVENSASTGDIVSESILLPIQYIGETSGNILERSHELAVCGNGIQEFQEVCDGGDFNGKTCSDFSFNSGSLTCSSNCLALVTGSCNNTGTGLVQTPTPISTPAPAPAVTLNPLATAIVSGGENSGGINGGGSSSNSGGGKNPLLLITPTPQPESSFHAVSSSLPQPTTVVSEESSEINIDPSQWYVNNYEESGLGSDLILNNNEIINEEVYNEEVVLSSSPLDTIFLNEDIDIENIENIFIADPDMVPLSNNIFDNESASIIDFSREENQNIAEFENQNIEIFHGVGKGDNIEEWGLGCGKYYWIILLIVFLLGMLTEYIISSVLLIHKK